MRTTIGTGEAIQILARLLVEASNESPVDLSMLLDAFCDELIAEPEVPGDAAKP